MLKKWDELPDFMKNDYVKQYYHILSKKRFELFLKRLFDLFMSFALLILLSIPMVLIAIFIKLDSPGPVFYRQERVTLYGRKFKIHKFRTMVSNAEVIGSAITICNDRRITRIGSRIRGLRLDELPQLIDVLYGDMSFVGTRPEATKYVEKYTDEMYATLLLPAGITSESSIRYKNEADMLCNAENVDKVYIEKVLPEKMKYNLKSIKNFSLLGEIATMIRTVFAVLGKDYN